MTKLTPKLIVFMIGLFGFMNVYVEGIISDMIPNRTTQGILFIGLMAFAWFFMNGRLNPKGFFR